MKPHQFRDIDDYISSFPADLRKLLKEIRMTIRRAVPPAEEAIKYNMPAFKLNDRAVYFGGERLAKVPAAAAHAIRTDCQVGHKPPKTKKG
jgi:uncharacterized protein YdhG (YjbR/CyaY superfamily)